MELNTKFICFLSAVTLRTNWRLKTQYFISSTNLFSYIIWSALLFKNEFTTVPVCQLTILKKPLRERKKPRGADLGGALRRALRAQQSGQYLNIRIYYTIAFYSFWQGTHYIIRSGHMDGPSSILRERTNSPIYRNPGGLDIDDRYISDETSRVVRSRAPSDAESINTTHISAYAEGISGIFEVKQYYPWQNSHTSAMGYNRFIPPAFEYFYTIPDSSQSEVRRGWIDQIKVIGNPGWNDLGNF